MFQLLLLLKLQTEFECTLETSVLFLRKMLYNENDFINFHVLACDKDQWFCT